MTREEALQALLSDSAHSRLGAARFLARTSEPRDLPVLQERLRNETVTYVRQGLETAINRVSKSVLAAKPADVGEYEVPSDVLARLRNEVTAEIAGLILHEIASSVGLVALSAAREVPDFERSKTKYFVEKLKRVFVAIENLKCAAAVPKPEEFDLAHLVHELASDELDGVPFEISVQGPKPFIINSDRALLALAISNGLRNAIEAAAKTCDAPHPVIVAWGNTDVDYWVSILDCGPGIAGPTEAAFGIGKTTKKGHTGFGLAIARQAVETLGGKCTLQHATEGGAKFEIRWEK